MKPTALPDTESFLQQCRVSSSAAHDQFCELLAGLDDDHTRRDAAQLLHRISQRYHALEAEGQHAEVLAGLNFSCNRLAVSAAGEAPRHLELLQFPSSFSPEEWSFTFYEGLTRYPESEFHERTVIELGCGNGWITLALALRCQPKTMVGVDINPKAIVLSRLNLYLNAFDADGNLRLDDEGKSLLDRVVFAESDLLSYVFAQKGGLIPDVIVGCIPQVLNPDPDALLTIAPGLDSDERLYALSNYCDKQGYVEDQFGLGLIARALEESVALMRPMGKIIFNLGGRPGAHVLERMFLRRGFHLKKIWGTKVNQAQDTDILALVNIEKSSSHRFEFYMSPHSDEPISATTAWRYAQTGGPIFHALTVYEAELAFPGAVKTVLQHLQGPSFEQARSSLDLSFELKDIAEERMSFLADFCSQLDQTVCFPYLATSGDIAFRQQIAAFLRSYFQLDLTPEHFLVAPTRADILRSMITLYAPARVLVDQRLARVMTDGDSDFARAVELIEAPRRVDLTCRLMAQLKPQLVMTALADFEQKSPESFVRLVQEAKAQNCLLLVDISDSFDLSSHPANNGVFQFMAEQPLPQHVILLCGLVKNRVYSDMEISFVLTQNATLLQHLEAAAELGYSRAPSMNQHYYRRLLQDLLYFQRPQRLAQRQADGQTSGLASEQASVEAATIGLPLTEAAKVAFTHPAITTNHLPMNRDTTRLDYGENCLPTPQVLKAALLESFVRQHIGHDEIELDATLAQVLESRFGLSAKLPGKFVYGGGIAPIFASFCQYAAEAGALLLMPQGGYDNFAAAASLYGLTTRELATTEEHQFKLDAQTLAVACASLGPGFTPESKKVYLYLNGPIVNPTGSLYSSAELLDIARVARRFGVTLILDTVFSGLEFGQDARMGLDEIIGAADLHAEPLRLLLLSGISKEFAAGGLRFGYAYSRDVGLIDALKAKKTHKPHATLFYAVKRLCQAWLAQDAGLLDDLAQQRQVLQARATRLTARLREYGWQVLPSHGGLFMVAKPAGYVGKSMTIRTAQGEQTVQLDSNNIDQALFYSVNLLINNARWTGLPGYCRLVLSVSEDEFEAGLAKLARFHQMVTSLPDRIMA